MSQQTMSQQQIDELHKQQKQQRMAELAGQQPEGATGVDGPKGEPGAPGNPQQAQFDIDKNISYNTNVVNTTTQTATATDPEKEELERILVETFGGDAAKAVKSWKAAQSSFQRVDREKRDMLTKLQSNPQLFDLVQKALNGEQIDENLLGKRESKDQPGFTNVNQPASQIVDVTEQELVQAGLLDPRQKSVLSEAEWQRLVLRAEAQYLPQKVARETMQRIEQEQALRQQQAWEAQVQAENQSRFARSLEETAATFGLDFTGEHKDLLPELEEAVFAFRDRKDPANFIHPQAVQLAFAELAREKGMAVKQVSKPQTNTQIFETGFNPTKPVSVPPQTTQQLNAEEKYIQQKRQQRAADIQRHRERFIRNR